MARELKPYETAIAHAEKAFAAADGLKYDREKIFAMQALMKSPHSMQVASANPLSVNLAMQNVAATGLTLNPAYGYAYLLPRDGAIVLDISCKGLLKIATDTGSIIWARADVVHSTDEFVYNGPAAAPIHRADVFNPDRGPIVGAYCQVKTADGDMLTETIALADLECIRAKSDLWSRKKSGPWEEFFSEMCRKAVIKRAHKRWPHSERMNRLVEAIELANQSEGGYTMEAQPVALISESQAANLQDMFDSCDIPRADVLALFDVDTIEAIPALRYREVIATLNVKRLANDNP